MPPVVCLVFVFAFFCHYVLPFLKDYFKGNTRGCHCQIGPKKIITARIMFRYQIVINPTCFCHRSIVIFSYWNKRFKREKQSVKANQS